MAKKTKNPTKSKKKPIKKMVRKSTVSKKAVPLRKKKLVVKKKPIKKIKAVAKSKSRKKVVSRSNPKPKKRSVINDYAYMLNLNFELFAELKNFILKPSPEELDRLSEKMSKIGRIKLGIVSGIFLSEKYQNEETVTDLFIVGEDIDKRKLSAFIKSVEAETGTEVRYAVMDKDEFDYRYGMFDRFIRVLLEGPHKKLINKLAL